MPSKKKPRSNKALKGDTTEGVVIRSTGSHTWVNDANGKTFECTIRGKFRIQGIKSTNPVAVGDKVKFMLPGGEDDLGLITEILPRHNYILRKAISRSHMVHILCANVDQALLIYTIEQPQTSNGFANRFLVITEAYHIPTRILINKVDLLQSPKQLARLKEVRDIYENAGYEVIEINSLDEEYKPQIMELLAGKISFVCGHSGAGKSTMVNLISPGLNIKTANVSDYNDKGRHTTTFTEMHALGNEGYIIDSPGIKEIGITNFDKYDLSHYFPEMRERLADCKFNNCIHIHEPGCAVQKAIEAGEIHASRYDTYLRMLEEIKSDQEF